MRQQTVCSFPLSFLFACSRRCSQQISSWQFRPLQLGTLTIGLPGVKSMVRAQRHLRIVLCLFLGCISVSAQAVQFLPEVDTYLKLNSMFRVYNETKDDRDGGDSTQVTSGPSVQLYLKPILKLKKITTFDLDDAKPRALVLEAGYRYITAPNEPFENRFLTAVTFHFPLKAAFLAIDRNRADLDWKGGTFEWRYRNRFTLERTFAIYSYHLIPYVAFEPFYESQYNKWSTTTEYVGTLLPVGKHVEFNPYYEHENDTGKAPNKQENYVGLAVYFFFSVLDKQTPDQ
jgi:hypothetical protein